MTTPYVFRALYGTSDDRTLTKVKVTFAASLTVQFGEMRAVARFN
ncbi:MULTISPECIES: hypothetical protein [unclassified Rhizobium]|nr:MULTISPECIES: hypothetical protein [unclassified Rhizobium]